jgi:predicted lactoylglutathione lyase
MSASVREKAKAIEAGGSNNVNEQETSWKYCNGFADLDGHEWEVFWYFGF